MDLYNKIMTKVWLIIAMGAFAITTYKCLTEDYRQWIFYYIIVVVALFMYLVKVWMIKRMKKHLKEMETKNGK